MKNKELCIGLNPILFIDYKGYSSYPGLDLNLCFRNKNIIAETGILAGNSYPILPYLNYYIGTGVTLPLKRNWEFQLKTKFMFSYYSYKDNYKNQFIRNEKSLVIGPGVLKTIKRLKLGIEYDLWWSNYDYSIISNDYRFGSSRSLNSKKGFVQTGIVIFKIMLILKN